MSNQMRQSEAALTLAASRVAECRKELDALSTTLDGQLHSLQGHWQGQGGAAFMKLHRAWDQRQREITSALDRFEQSLILTEKDNIATDDAISSSFNQITARLS